MKAIRVPLKAFALSRFLNALHHFDLSHAGDGNPLPAVVGDTVYHDPVLLAEALAPEASRSVDIPSDSMRRLRAGMSVYGAFAAYDGFVGLDFADGSRIEVQGEDEGDELLSFGCVISLVGDVVEIEGRCLSDVSGDCELETLAEPSRIASRMRRWVKSFILATPKRNTK